MRDMETARATAVTERRVWRLCDDTCFIATKRSKREAIGDKAGYDSALNVYRKRTEDPSLLREGMNAVQIQV